MPENSQEKNLIKLSEGQSLEAAKRSFEWLPVAHDLDRTEIILTLLDFKAGVEISPPDPMLTDMTTELFQGLGLFYVTGEKKTVWYVAKSQADAQRLCQAFEVTGDIREQGRMSGYPESAVENYAKTMEPITTSGRTEEEVYDILSESFGDLKVPPEILNEDFMAFLSFRLSASNWQSELEVVKKWAEAIKSFDAPLYERIVRIYHPVRGLNVALGRLFNNKS